MPAARPAPDPRLFAHFVRINPSRGSGALRAGKHRLSRAVGRSFICRSLGLAPASSPALGGLRKLSLECAKVLAAFARSWGALRNRECPGQSACSLGTAHMQAAWPAPVAGATCAASFRWRTRKAPLPNPRGLRALARLLAGLSCSARPIAVHWAFKRFSNRLQTLFKRCRIRNQTFIKGAI